MKKRILSAGLVLCLILGLSLPVGAVSNSTPTFTDVPETHWAYSYVERAAENGWVSGVGNGKFGIDNQVTYAELSTMLVRAFFNDVLDGYMGPDSAPWYEPYCAAMATTGLFSETKASNGYSTVALQPINRYEMTQILYNVLEYEDVELSYNAASIQAGIGDWNTVPSNYRDALTAVVAAGMISGVDSKGTFSGNSQMTRGQAAVVMCRTADIVKAGETTTPVDPTDPGDSEGLGQKLSSGATAAAGVKSSIGKDDAYPTYGNSDVVSNNGYFTGATDVEIGDAQLVYEFLDMVNEVRVAEGHEPLAWVQTDSAEEHTLQRCTELVSNYSHERPKGKFSGEVIAEGYGSVQMAFNGWINSPGHKRTLMSDSYKYLSAAMTTSSAGNRWIICVWTDVDIETAEQFSSSNYDYSEFIDG